MSCSYVVSCVGVLVVNYIGSQLQDLSNFLVGQERISSNLPKTYLGRKCSTLLVISKMCSSGISGSNVGTIYYCLKHIKQSKGFVPPIFRNIVHAPIKKLLAWYDVYCQYNISIATAYSRRIRKTYVCYTYIVRSFLCSKMSGQRLLIGTNCLSFTLLKHMMDKDLSVRCLLQHRSAVNITAQSQP